MSFFKSGLWAKIAGWTGAALTALGGIGALGKTWSPIAMIVGGALTGHGVHVASNNGKVVQ